VQLARLQSQTLVQPAPGNLDALIAFELIELAQMAGPVRRRSEAPPIDDEAASAHEVDADLVRIEVQDVPLAEGVPSVEEGD
jgi:hypothetical protein